LCSRVLVVSEGPDAAEGLRREGDATRVEAASDRAWRNLIAYIHVDESGFSFRETDIIGGIRRHVDIP
jgi:hypothetical protein